MSTYHEVPIVVTDVIAANLEANIQVIQNTFNDFEITEDELAALPKMGPRRYTFHVESFHQARLYSSILYHNRSYAAYELVRNNYEKLVPVYRKFLKAYLSFTTVMQVLGSNNYAFGRSTYEAINGTNNDGIAGIEDARKTLSAFFKGQGVVPEDPENKDKPFLPGTNGDSGNGGGNTN